MLWRTSSRLRKSHLLRLAARCCRCVGCAAAGLGWRSARGGGRPHITTGEAPLQALGPVCCGPQVRFPSALLSIVRLGDAMAVALACPPVHRCRPTSGSAVTCWRGATPATVQSHQQRLVLLLKGMLHQQGNCISLCTFRPCTHSTCLHLSCRRKGRSLLAGSVRFRVDLDGTPQFFRLLLVQPEHSLARHILSSLAEVRLAFLR